jgi:hypothetical protein
MLYDVQNAWPEMLQTLLSNVTGQFADGTKAASLQALGYMCDEVSELSLHSGTAANCIHELRAQSGK